MAARIFAVLILLLCLGDRAEAQIALSYNAGAHQLGLGFSRAHWVPTLNCMLTDVAGATNDIQCFNPVTDSWVIVFESDRHLGYPNGIAAIRDNQCSFYVPARKELWEWCGSHMDTNASQPIGATGAVISGPTNGSDGVSRYNVNWTNAPDGWVKASSISVVGGAVTATENLIVYENNNEDTLAGPVYQSGRISIAGCEPIPTLGCATVVWRSKFIADMDSTLVKNNVSAFGADPGCAWNSVANGGLCGFAFNGANAQNIMIVEPNTGSSVCAGGGVGAQTYIACEIDSGAHLIPPRVQCMGCMAAGDGSNIYIYGGKWNDGSGEQPRLDLFRYNMATHTLTPLAPSPSRGEWSWMTYDSHLNKLVVWSGAGSVFTGNKLLIYDIKTDTWTNPNVPNQPCIDNNLGVYAPTVRAHVYESGTGGVACGSGSGYNNVYGIAVEGSTVNGLSLQHGVWTAVPLPTGNSPFTPAGGTKQWQVSFRNVNSKMYFWGGDGGPLPVNINGTYSVDLGNLSAGNSAWTVEVPQCVTPPDIAPQYPTEDSFVYDSQRDRFYWLGGGHFGPLEKCATADAIIHKGPAMTLDPTTNKWSISAFSDQVASGFASSASQAALYDPVTDRVYQVAECTSGMCMSILNPAGTGAGAWSSVEMTCATNLLASQSDTCGGTVSKINSGFSKVEQHFWGIDTVGRKIYFIRQRSGSNPPILVQWDIDAHTSTVYDVPLPSSDWTAVSWDKENRKLLWVTSVTDFVASMRIFIFDPATSLWTEDPKFNPKGIAVMGDSFGYDPYHNAHILIGGAFFSENPGNISHSCGSDPQLSACQYYFLYRYGATTNPQAILTVNSSVPTNGVALTVTPTDVNAQSNGLTSFMRTYNIADTITAAVTAPASFTVSTIEYTFASWTGCDATTGSGGRTCQKMMGANYTISVDYNAAVIGGGGNAAKIGGSVQIGSGARLGN